MKKFLGLILLCLSSQVLAISVPSNYGLLEKNDGVTSYKNKSWVLHSFFSLFKIINNFFN